MAPTPVKIDAAGFDPNAAGDGNIFGLDLREADASVVFVPVPWDATVSYGEGTALGPEAIRRASRQVDLADADLLPLGLGRPWQYGLYIRPARAELEDLNAEARAMARPIIERGGVLDGDRDLTLALDEVNLMSEEVNQIVREEVAELIEAGKVAAVIGGEHSVSYGSIQAYARRYPGMGLLQIDAHADLRPAYEGFRHSHASIVFNVLDEIAGVRSVTQVGVRDVCDQEIELIDRDDRIRTFFQADLRARIFGGEPWRAICESIVATLPKDVYVTFDIDGLDPALCPNTGTPVPGGLGFEEALYLLKTLHLSGRRLVGFDLTEVAPGADGSEWDGNVGARVLYKLAAVSLLSLGARD